MRAKKHFRFLVTNFVVLSHMAAACAPSTDESVASTINAQNFQQYGFSTLEISSLSKPINIDGVGFVDNIGHFISPSDTAQSYLDPSGGPDDMGRIKVATLGNFWTDLLNAISNNQNNAPQLTREVIATASWQQPTMIITQNNAVVGTFSVQRNPSFGKTLALPEAATALTRNLLSHELNAQAVSLGGQFGALEVIDGVRISVQEPVANLGASAVNVNNLSCRNQLLREQVGLIERHDQNAAGAVDAQSSDLSAALATMGGVQFALIKKPTSPLLKLKNMMIPAFTLNTADFDGDVVVYNLAGTQASQWAVRSSDSAGYAQLPQLMDQESNRSISPKLWNALKAAADYAREYNAYWARRNLLTALVPVVVVLGAVVVIGFVIPAGPLLPAAGGAAALASQNQNVQVFVAESLEAAQRYAYAMQNLAQRGAILDPGTPYSRLVDGADDVLQAVVQADPTLADKISRLGIPTFIPTGVQIAPQVIDALQDIYPP